MLNLIIILILENWTIFFLVISGMKSVQERATACNSVQSMLNYGACNFGGSGFFLIRGNKNHKSPKLKELRFADLRKEKHHSYWQYHTRTCSATKYRYLTRPKRIVSMLTQDRLRQHPISFLAILCKRVFFFWCRFRLHFDTPPLVEGLGALQA